MPYFQNEIARTRDKIQAAEQEIARLEALLAAQTRARDEARAVADDARQRVADLERAFRELPEATAAAEAADRDAAAHDTAAAELRGLAGGARGRAAGLRAQIADIDSRIPRIPEVVQARDAADRRVGELEAEIQEHLAAEPLDFLPNGKPNPAYRVWLQRLGELELEQDAAQQRARDARGWLAETERLRNERPGLVAAAEAADNEANQHDAEANRRAALAQTARDRAAAERTRAAELAALRDRRQRELTSGLQTEIERLQGELQAADRRVGELEAEIQEHLAVEPLDFLPNGKPNPAYRVWLQRLGELELEQEAAQQRVQEIRDRLAQLTLPENVLGQAEAMRREAELRLDEAETALAATREDLDAERTRLATARTVLAEAEMMAAEVEREPLDRAALEELAARLAALTREREQAEAAQRDLVEELTRALNESISRHAFLTSEGQRLATEVAGAESGLSAAEAAAATAQRNVNAHVQQRPHIKRIAKSISSDPRDPGIEWEPDPAELANWFSELERLRDVRDAALATAQEARRRHDDLRAQRDNVEKERVDLDRLLDDGLRAALSGAEQQLRVLADRAEEYRAARDATTARLLGGVGTGHPVALLPVRLETRFVTAAGGPQAEIEQLQGELQAAERRVGELAAEIEEHLAAEPDRFFPNGKPNPAHPEWEEWLAMLERMLDAAQQRAQEIRDRLAELESARPKELLVRVYPDDLHPDSHEPELTADEKVWGLHFREETAAADAGPPADRESARQRAWEQLAERFGPQRAAWIARSFDSTPAETIPERASPWTRAARTNVLPDRWVAIAYPRDGGLPVVAWGELIPDSLALGPSPQSDVGGNGEMPPGVDDEMRWLIDLNEALDKGMALRIPLTSTQAAEGFERLVVVGVRSGLDADASAGRLAALFDAHHYTSGLAFVPQNTPTNNTEEVRSGYRSGDGSATGDRGYRAERGPSLVAVPGTDGGILARALGLDASLFEHVLHAEGLDQAAAAAMNRALWPATGGWWLAQAVTGAAPGDDGGRRTAAWRDHFADLVRARGPLPAFRVGNQPYGVLPITSVKRWQPPAPGVGGSLTPSEIGDALRAVLPAWDRARAHVLTLGIRGSGVEAGRPLPPGYRGMSQKDLLPIVLGQEATSCGYTLRRFADNARFKDPSVALARDPVSPDANFALRPPEPNYLRLLRESSFEAISAESYPGWDVSSTPRPHPLLYLLLRRAALVALAPGADAAGATAFREALGELEALPDRTLRALMAETLDLSAYRFDAWVTSLATSRLERLRERNPRGIRLGGYGWVENLRPGPMLQPAPVLEENGPVLTSPANQGFVQAPSLTHAATAAVLRSGYLSEKRAGGSGEALAVDLSSARMRQAEWLLEGVRQGQSLGSLLGYRFERGLHEDRLDHYIDRFRTLAALREEEQLATAYQTFRQAFEAEAAVASEVSRLQAEVRAAGEQVRKEETLIGGLQQRRMGPADDVLRIEGYAAEARSARAAAARLDEQIRQAQGRRPRTRISKRQNDEQIDFADSEAFDVWLREIQALTAQRSLALNQARQLESRYQVEAGTLAAALKEIEAIDALLRAAEERRSAQAEVKRQRENDVIAREQKRGELAVELAAARTALRRLLESQWAEALESLAAVNVVDGLELHRRFRLGLQSRVWDGTTIPFDVPALGFPPSGEPEHGRLIAHLRALGDAVDAVGDAVVAEGVYQLVQGNPLRSGATLDAIARGEAPPPELEVARTPRTGVGLTHRVLALFDPSIAQASAPEWNTGVQSARAKAEPLLNGWVATLLPDPSRVRCGAAYIYRKTGEVIDTTDDVLLRYLDLSPLDVLFLAEGDEEAQMGELEQRLTYLLLRRYEEHRRASGTGPDPADVDVRLTFARASDEDVDWVTFGELLEVARTARKLVAGSRFLQPNDLALPEAAAGAHAFEIDVEEMRGRAQNAEETLRETHRLLLDALMPDATIEQMQTALLSAAQFGIPGAIPRFPLDLEPGTLQGEAAGKLREQADSVNKEIGRRLGQIDALPSEPGRDHDLGRIAAIFGPDFRVLPHLKPRPGVVTELPQAFGRGDSFLDNDPLAAVTWLQRAARVRDGVSRLDASLLYAEAIGGRARLASLFVGQLPFNEADRWVALKQGGGKSIPGGRLSLVVHVPAGGERPAFDDQMAGLLIDEWVEVVPGRTETTGLTFHFDQPDARAPQSVLLAVAPDDRRAVWDLDTLTALLSETFDLAEMRAADPVALVDAGVGLPPSVWFAEPGVTQPGQSDLARAAAP